LLNDSIPAKSCTPSIGETESPIVIPDDDDCISFALSAAKNSSGQESIQEDLRTERVPTPGKFAQSECDLKIEMQLYQVTLLL